MKTIYYYCEEHDPQASIALQASDSNVDVLISLCASDYYHHHDGWEARWPLIFGIRLDEGGPVVARFEVDREAVPQFTAKQLA